MTSSAGPVIVGIDGSRAAIRAAEWAIDEAITRNVPLRLVHVIHVGESSIDQSELPMELEYGESALRDAVATVKAARKPVKTDTEVLYGSVDTALVTESLGASMICVGSVGIGRMSRMLLGSTATALAEKAHCPVAIIRSDGDVPAEDGPIGVVVENEPDSGAVLHQALEEARLRNAPVLALRVTPWKPGEVPYDELDSRLNTWTQRYPDVPVTPVDAHTDAAHYLGTHDNRVRLAVVGVAGAKDVARLVGPHGFPILAHADCSVLVVRR